MTDPGQLDEKGFVFLDGFFTPYYVRLCEGEPWLFYWHKSSRWVSLRKVDQMFVQEASGSALLPELAEAYHRKHRENTPSLHGW
jgi:hypothetical protein